MDSGLGVKQKLYEVTRLRFQAWPYKGMTDWGNEKRFSGYDKLPGPTGACFWSPLKEHRDITVKGRLEVWPNGDMKGKFNGWYTAFYPGESLEHWFTRGFYSWSSAVHTGEAREVLAFIKGGMDYADFYFEELQQGGDEDALFEWIKKQGVRPTTGVYICKWDPSQVDIPLFEGINVLEEMARGKKLSEILKEHEEKQTSDRLRDWLTKKGLNTQRSMDEF